MSHTSSTAPSSRAVQSLLSAAGAMLSGKKRGPDRGEGQRVPRRESYEVTDPRAKPWRMIGDGTVTQGIIHCEALLATAKALRLQLWKEYPIAEVRRRTAERAIAKAELAELNTCSPAEIPAGRRAVLRMSIDKLDAWLKKANDRLTPHDILVLEALLSCLDFATGRLFPTVHEVARRAGVHYNTAVAGLRRLRIHGLISRVRRTIRTGNAGAAGPQLEQTSNAYYFDHRRKMASRTWQTYWKRLCAALRRLGARRPPAPVLSLVGAAAAPLTPMQAAIASLGSKIAEREPTT